MADKINTQQTLTGYILLGPVDQKDVKGGTHKFGIPERPPTFHDGRSPTTDASRRVAWSRGVMEQREDRCCQPTSSWFVNKYAKL